MGTGGPFALKILTTLSGGAPSGTQNHAECRFAPRQQKEFSKFFHRASHTSKVFDQSILAPSEQCLIDGAPSGTRTPDPLIKSQLLYQLS